MPSPAERRLRLQLQGLVQGVGLRPQVVRLATVLGLRGWVTNGLAGVELELQGPPPALEAFVRQLLANPPARARIDGHSQRWGPALGEEPAGVRILPVANGSNDVSPSGTALISPDLAICSTCLAELADPANRRCGYPWISCTDCGPRYSLVERLPFERQHTSLAVLPPCGACAREYADPADRRFHAQTISCPACGPQLHWNGTPLGSAAAIGAAAAALLAGQLVALQGVGGFQLLADPADPQALARLRRRKGRPDKPLALMANRPWLERHCHCSPQEWALWHSPAAPILLLRRREGAGGIDPAVAGCSPWLGVMRPSTGLHQLLLEQCGGVVVATSANRSGEPIALDANTDAALLSALADGVLSHTLRIVNRIDDSVMRCTAEGPVVLRLGRGLAPLALPAVAAAGGQLALGAERKGSLALRLPAHRLLSPDLGDLSTSAGARHLQQTNRRWLERHGYRPEAIACDGHRGYSASQLAEQLAQQLAGAEANPLPLLRVQHHHAHLLAVMAEHGLSTEQLGVAWDGAGQGDDGSLWGGEALWVTPQGYRRLARLRPWALPGGSLALREPRRAALGLLLAAYGRGWRQRLAALPPRRRLAWQRAFAAEQLEPLERSLMAGFNSPHCSSAGRLFDAVAALLGVAQRCSYEAQAAIELEGLALRALEPPCRLALPLRRCGGPTAWIWDWAPLLEQLLQAIGRGHSPAAISLGFHRALANAIAELATAAGARQLLLAGGCFQNSLLLELSVAALRQRGIAALWSQQLPSNDAAVAMGQLLALDSVPTHEAAARSARHVPGRRR